MSMVRIKEIKVLYAKKRRSISIVDIDGKIFVAKKYSTEKREAFDDETAVFRHLDENLHQPCPYIVNGFFTIKSSQTYSIIMEYLPGGNLDAYLNNNTVTMEELRCASAQMVAAIAYLHSKNIVHRDVKLTNFAITSDGSIKIIDFGLSKRLWYKKKPMSRPCGTKHYMAPEIETSKEYFIDVDWYAFGKCLEFMVQKCHRDSFIQKDLLLFDLIEHLTKFKRTERLRSSVEIKKHRFFRNTDWDDVDAGLIKKPLLIILNDPLDFRYITNIPASKTNKATMMMTAETTTTNKYKMNDFSHNSLFAHNRRTIVDQLFNEMVTFFSNVRSCDIISRDRLEQIYMDNKEQMKLCENKRKFFNAMFLLNCHLKRFNNGATVSGVQATILHMELKRTLKSNADASDFLTELIYAVSDYKEFILLQNGIYKICKLYEAKKFLDRKENQIIKEILNDNIYFAKLHEFMCDLQHVLLND